MRKVMNCYRNWRLSVVLLLGLCGIVTGCSESGETMTDFLLTALGMLLFVAAWLLGRWWHRRGKLPEIDDIGE